ncbi:MAG: hypothetical protein GYB65_02375, partial [Chloroflexi bacterium]|nr:hypothetical protein [Chloroflexota bacterium]
YWPSIGVPRMVEIATNPVTVQMYASNAHGVNLLDYESDTLVPLIMAWLVAPGVPQGNLDADSLAADAIPTETPTPTPTATALPE